MFEDYLIDSYSFYEKAETCADERESKKYYRASIFYALSSMESFANYLADTFNKGGSLSEFEIAFLLDKRLFFNADKIEVEDRIEFHRIEDKLKIFIKKFVTNFDFTCRDWSHFNEFKKFRDRLVHPRESEDNLSLNDYQDHLKRGLTSIINLMNIISTGVFKKHLRKQLLDLLP